MNLNCPDCKGWGRLAGPFDTLKSGPTGELCMCQYLPKPFTNVERYNKERPVKRYIVEGEKLILQEKKREI